MKEFKTIKVFLASSEELDYDRQAFGNLVRRLNDIYKRRGIYIDLFEWEDADASYNGGPKQLEYDERVRASNMFLALFHIKAGEFTIHEFDVAIEMFRLKKSPKVYVYCKNLQQGEVESPELTEFKRRVYEDMGHYWVRYSNKDTFQLNFVMQLELLDSKLLDNLKVNDGVVTLNGEVVSRMDQLSFVADNENYKRMSQRLRTLQKEIEDARLLVDKYPEEAVFEEKLYHMLEEQELLRNEFEQYQQFLLDTAKRIAQLRENVITDRMRRAMEAFEAGDPHKANILLEEVEHDADLNLDNYRLSKSIAEQNRKNVICSIEELLLKTSTLMADSSIGSIEQRVAMALKLYQKADESAREVDYDKEKYQLMLFGYARFLLDYGHYEEAISVYERQIAMVDDVIGKNTPVSAISYNNLASIYLMQGLYDKAQEYFSRALAIDKAFLAPDDPSIAGIYNNLASVCRSKGDSENALYYYHRALSIFESVQGVNHPNTAACYNNIGEVYCYQGDFAKALEYYNRALDIVERELGEHPNTASTCGNIGRVHFAIGDYEKASGFFLKALNIREKVLGKNHPVTSASYSDLGMLYHSKGELDKALEYYTRAHDICMRLYGENHPDVATDYQNIGSVYMDKGDANQALDYYCKSLGIWERLFGENHPSTAMACFNVGGCYIALKNYDKAMEQLAKALSVQERFLGKEHPQTVSTYGLLGRLYYHLGKIDKALMCYKNVLAVMRKQLGEEHPQTQAVRGMVAFIEQFA